MTPVLRVIIPTVSLTEAVLQNLVTKGANVDYITDDPDGLKAVPLGALYAARMDKNGVVTVVLAKSGLLTPAHTYSGWPIPA